MRLYFLLYFIIWYIFVFLCLYCVCQSAIGSDSVSVWVPQCSELSLKDQSWNLYMYKCHTYRIIQSQTNAACFGIDLKNSAFFCCSYCCCWCCRRMCHIHTRSHTHIQIVNKIMLASAQAKKKEKLKQKFCFFAFIHCLPPRAGFARFPFFCHVCGMFSMFLFRYSSLSILC